MTAPMGGAVVATIPTTGPEMAQKERPSMTTPQQKEKPPVCAGGLRVSASKPPSRHISYDPRVPRPDRRRNPLGGAR